MRPRVFPAEDHGRVLGHRREAIASMRPRVFPAEDTSTSVTPLPTFAGFNEAAGIPRGRRVSIT